MLNCGGRVEPYKCPKGNFIGPLRIWKKYEQVPGLMMSRSFGDKIAHSCGCISTPEVKFFDLRKQVKSLVLGSDGLWEVIPPQNIINFTNKYSNPFRADLACQDLLELASNNWINKVLFVQNFFL